MTQYEFRLPRWIFAGRNNPTASADESPVDLKELCVISKGEVSITFLLESPDVAAKCESRLKQDGIWHDYRTLEVGDPHVLVRVCEIAEGLGVNNFVIAMNEVGGFKIQSLADIRQFAENLIRIGPTSPN